MIAGKGPTLPVRPEVLFPLFAPLTNLKGVGPRMAKLFEGLAGDKVIDLCWHLPQALIDRRYSPDLGRAEPGRVATLGLRVDAHEPPRNPRGPYRVYGNDGSDTIELAFFHARPDYLSRVLPVGGRVAVSGKLETFGGRWQMTHPDQIVPAAEIESLKVVEPQYGLTAGLTQKSLRKAIEGALAQAPDLPEWLGADLLQREGWSPWRAALAAAHHPGDHRDLEPDEPHRRRLAYDELLANQLAIALVRRQQTRQQGRPLQGDGALRRQVLAALPFRLTDSQKQALRDIADDMESANRMLRLLQGDVGSGKTLVALPRHAGRRRGRPSGGHHGADGDPRPPALYQTLAPLVEAAGYP